MPPNTFKQSIGNIPNPFKNNGLETKDSLRVSAIREFAKNLKLDISSIEKINGNKSMKNPLINNTGIKELIVKDELSSEELTHLNELIKDEIQTLIGNLVSLNEIASPKVNTDIKTEAESLLEVFLKEKMGKEKFNKLSKEDLSQMAQKAGVPEKNGITSLSRIKMAGGMTWNATKKIGKGAIVTGKIVKGTFTVGIPLALVCVVGYAGISGASNSIDREKQAVANFLDSSRASDLLDRSGNNVQSESVLAKEGVNDLISQDNYLTGIEKMETLFSDFDNFGINKDTLSDYGKLTTSDIEKVLSSSNKKGAGQFIKLTVSVKEYLKNNREYFDGGIMTSGDVGKATMKTIYAREYAFFNKKIKNSSNEKIVGSAKAQLNLIKDAIMSQNFKNSSETITFNQMYATSGSDVITTKKVKVKVSGEKTLFTYQ